MDDIFFNLIKLLEFDKDNTVYSYVLEFLRSKKNMDIRDKNF
jgi:hypothetical protein